MNETDQLVAVKQHIQKFWSGHIVELDTWSRGPILERVPRFVTFRIAPQRVGEAWVYVTAGCSMVDQEWPNEFFIMAPDRNQVHTETLAMIGHFHSFEAHRLDVGSVMNIGRPWVRGSRMDHVLTCVPYPYGPRLEWASEEAGRARFLWALPIYKEEAEFIKRQSLEVFEYLMDRYSVNILDPNRKPVS